MTNYRQEGIITSEIYDELISFWFSFKLTTIEASISKICGTFNKLASQKDLSLPDYVNELCSYALVISFGEFWDFASFLYRTETDPSSPQQQRPRLPNGAKSGLDSGLQKKIKISFLRSNTQFQEYMTKLLEFFSSEMMRQVMIERQMEIVYSCHSILKELSTLPVKPVSSEPEIDPTVRKSFEMIIALVDFQASQISDLFKDELFCYFYSLFKQFVDDVKSDLKERIIHLSSLIVEQLFQNFSTREFLKTHPLSIPDSDSPDQFSLFKEQEELYLR